MARTLSAFAAAGLDGGAAAGAASFAAARHGATATAPAAADSTSKPHIAAASRRITSSHHGPTIAAPRRCAYGGAATLAPRDHRFMRHGGNALIDHLAVESVSSVFLVPGESFSPRSMRSPTRRRSRP